MIIYDVMGGKYSLTRTMVKEVACVEFGNRYVLLKELNTDSDRTPVRYFPPNGRKEDFPNDLFNVSKTALGCREFEPKVYALIVKAAKAAKKGKKNAKRVTKR